MSLVLAQGWLLTLGLAAEASPLRAQETPSTRASSMCLRPGPRDECRTFLLFEVRGQSPFVQPYRDVVVVRDGAVVSSVPVKELSHSFGWDVGAAVNVSRSWAVGGVLGLELAEASRRETAKLRVRRWLTDEISVGLSPGVFRLVETGPFRPSGTTGDSDASRVGGSLALRVTLWDIGVVSLRYDALGVERRETPAGDGVRIDPGGLEQTWSAGVGLESVTGMWATGIGFVVFAVVASVGRGGLT